MDTRITCSVKWIQRVVCREIQGTLPEARPASQTAKTPNSEHLQGARGIHTLRGRQNDEPSSGPLQAWHALATHSLCLPVETVPLFAACRLGCRAFPHLGLNPALQPRTHGHGRDHYPGVHRVSQSVVCGDPSLTANAPQNAVWPPPLICCHTHSLSVSQHTHAHSAHTHNQKAHY